jgi:hypothetical protein
MRELKVRHPVLPFFWNGRFDFQDDVPDTVLPSIRTLREAWIASHDALVSHGARPYHRVAVNTPETPRLLAMVNVAPKLLRG